MKNGLLYCLLALLLTLEITTLLEFDDFNKASKKSTDIIEEKLNNKKVVLFTGDSITDYYDLTKYYNYTDINTYNTGISGYKTTDIIRRYDNMISQYHADKMFLLIGTNDIAKGTSNKEVIENTKEILLRARKNNPNIELYYISIYPVNNKVDGTKAGKRKNSNIKDVNKKMKSFCEENNITYIDLYSKLVDKNDQLKEDYTYDGLHINGVGYELITKTLKPYIEK